MQRRSANNRLTKTQKRKAQHLEICLETQAVTGPMGTGLDRYRFVHNALPEIDLDEIDLGVTFLGRRLAAPILISSMTGGKTSSCANSSSACLTALPTKL